MLLVGAAILPLLLSGGWIAHLAAARARAETSRRTCRVMKIVAKRIAAELATQVDVIRALAASPALDRPDLPAFRVAAERVRAEQPVWPTVQLTLPCGEQVLNLLRPSGGGLGRTAALRSLEEVMLTRHLVVGGIGPVGPVSGRRLVTLRVPVLRDERMSSILSMGIVSDSIGTLLTQADAPADCIGAVLDGTA